MSTNEKSWTLMSAYEHLWSFVGTQEQLRINCHGAKSALECSLLLISAHECSLCHGTMLKSAYDWSWPPMSTQGCSWPLIIAHESSWHFDHECSWFFWAIMSTNEYSSVLLSTIEHGANTRWAHVSIREHSWPLESAHGAMATFS